MDPAAVRALTDLGTVGLLIAVLIGGYRGWWVFGPVHTAIRDDLIEQRNFWRDQALRGTGLAEKAVDVAAGEPMAARHD